MDHRNVVAVAGNLQQILCEIVAFSQNVLLLLYVRTFCTKEVGKGEEIFEPFRLIAFVADFCACQDSVLFPPR